VTQAIETSLIYIERVDVIHNSIESVNGVVRARGSGELLFGRVSRLEGDFAFHVPEAEIKALKG
jgi:hypothetical protein